MSTPILTCANLNKSYTPGKPVLHNLNISLSGGKIVGLLGPNGCGKSTLLKLISGILVPDSGSIEVCGVPQSEETNALVSYLAYSCEVHHFSVDGGDVELEVARVEDCADGGFYCDSAGIGY